MKKITLLLAGLFVWGTAGASVINGSFETGDFTGWVVDGDATVEMVGTEDQDPTHGNYMADLEAGGGDCTGFTSNSTDCSYIGQFINLGAHQTLNFDWNFFNDEDDFEDFYNDFAWFLVDGLGQIILLADSSTTLNGNTGWNTYSYYAGSDGCSCSFFWLVSNVEDQSVDSHLLVDNIHIPEPGSLALLGLGLAALGLIRRRRIA